MAKDSKPIPQNKINELINLVSQLRDPQKGCPWDIEQTHESLIPFVLEEAYEVANAIRNQNTENLKEELGDLLFQIILHAQIASEKNRFNFENILQEITQKMIRRHPHVFEKKVKINIKQAQENWTRIKAQESKKEDSKSPISDKLKIKISCQPALAGAMQISQKIAKKGFEWESFSGVIEKMDEEIKELKEAIKNEKIDQIKSELGDVFFTLVNIARWLDLDPEESLAETNLRCLKRFSLLEESISEDLSKLSFHELQKYWQKAKIRIELENDE